MVAQVVGRHLDPWRGQMAMSARVAFFGDADVLAVVAAQDGFQRDADEALAWGMAYSGDRDLVLVLPERFSGPTLRRLPWVDLPARVLTYDGRGDVRERVVPAKGEALAEVLGWGLRSPGQALDLSPAKTEWIEALDTWASSHAYLKPAHRAAYRAWHCRGRQVLKVRSSKGGLVEIIAGVDYSTPSATRPGPVTLFVDRPLHTEEFHAATMAVEAAVFHRVAGDDSTDAEAWFQEEVWQLAPQLGLDPSYLHREYPAYRAGRTGAKIDILGVDSDGALHVVETKLGNDPMLALQVLDYWVWATANRRELARSLEANPEAAVKIDLVCGPKQPGADSVGPYTASQLEGIDGSISWRFVLANDHWRDGLELTALRSRQPPSGRRAMDPRYRERLDTRLLEHESAALRCPQLPFYAHGDSGIVPAARAAWRDLAERGLLHRFAAHVRSSQAFAVNLFGTLDEHALRSLLAVIGVEAASVGPVRFEFQDEDDLLAEATAASPHRTQVDAVVECTDAQGARTVLAIEVKLTERDFSHCSGFQSDRNSRRDVCASNGPFGGDPIDCFLLENYGRGPRRRYDRYIGQVDGPEVGCAFRGSLSQPMRSVALLEAILASGRADRAVYALMAPTAHKTIWRRWAEAKQAFAASAVRLVDLTADQVLNAIADETAEALRARYQL